MAHILGINYLGHDASACLLKDGKLVTAVEEERFTKKKHTGCFPVESTKYCLSAGDVNISDIDHIGYYINPRKLFNPGGIKNVFRPILLSRLAYLFACFTLRRNIRMKLGVKKGDLKCKIHFISHHLAHAASAYFPSQFKRSAILTMDGIGEWASGIFAIAEDKDIRVIKEIYFPNSLGYLYSAVTAYLGFVVNNDEYKVMGLASYGERSKYYDIFRKIVQFRENGTYKIDESFLSFGLTWGKVSKKFCKHFGAPRQMGEKIVKKHMDIAWALQKITEETGIHMSKWLHKETGSGNLCLAGGVALNCVMNGRILRETPFKHIYITPASYDAGTSIGSAAYIQNVILNDGISFKIEDAGIGPEYSDDDVLKEIKDRGLNYRKCGDIAKETAKILADGLIVGWVQGKSEFGPRALGHRSILADPTRNDMQDIINSRVKYREEFRPFAPSVTEEKCIEYFDISEKSPFMVLVCNVKEEKKHILPAVTHEDGTARVHTVSKEHNERYWRLLEEFEKIKGVPILLNTSFNVNRQPIVLTPKDAVECFLSTDIDALAINNFLVEK